MSDSSTSAHSSRRPKKRNGGMTADEKAKWRTVDALNLQTFTRFNDFKAGLNSAGAEAASTPKQMPAPQVETVEKIAEVPVPDVHTVEKIVEEPVAARMYPPRVRHPLFYQPLLSPPLVDGVRGQTAHESGAESGTVEKNVEEPARTPDAEADAAEAEAERVMFERFYGCIDHIYGKLIEVWR